MKIHANGIDIEYRIEGSGPWVMLSHSLSTDLRMWDGQAAALAGRYTVLRYDTRGHGGSGVPPAPYAFADMAADALALLDALGVAKASFVGLSMGGMIGQHLALAAPERLQRLVVASSTSRIPPEGAAIWEERIATVRARGMAAMVESTLGRWFTEAYRRDHPDVMERIGGMIGNSPPEGYIGCGMAIRALDITGRLAAVRTPTLVVVGEQDPGTPVAASRAIAEAIPGARLAVIPDASHLCNIQQAEEFSRLLLDFLAQD